MISRERYPGDIGNLRNMADKIRRVLHENTPFLPDLLKKTARENFLIWD
jgi:hypothetical protein